MASEQPGMGEAMGAVVGGAMGVAGGAGFAPGRHPSVLISDFAIVGLALLAVRTTKGERTVGPGKQ